MPSFFLSLFSFFTTILFQVIFCQNTCTDFYSHWQNFEVEFEENLRFEHEAQFQFCMSEQCKKPIAAVHCVVCVCYFILFYFISDFDWRCYTFTECIQPMYQLFLILAPQLLLLWKCIGVDLFLETVNVVACLCKSWPFSVTWSLLEIGY